jgi:hypothetical protein
MAIIFLYELFFYVCFSLTTILRRITDFLLKNCSIRWDFTVEISYKSEKKTKKQLSLSDKKALGKILKYTIQTEKMFDFTVPKTGRFPRE